MSFGKSKQSSSSAPLTADQVASYFKKLDEISGDRFVNFARGGTPGTHYKGVSNKDLVKAAPVAYSAPSADRVKALGGLGASRKAAIDRVRADSAEKIQSDPSLSTYQKVRANQLSDEDALDRLDAITQETEAAISGMVADSALRDLQAQTTNAQNNINAASTNLDARLLDAARKYTADANNAVLNREDLAQIAQIFFGGMGNTSASSGRSFNLGFGKE